MHACEIGMTSQPCEITMGGLGHVLACLRSVSTLGTRSVSTPQHLHKSGVFLPEATRKQAYQAGKNKVSTYFIFSTLGNTRYTLL